MTDRAHTNDDGQPGEGIETGDAVADEIEPTFGGEAGDDAVPDDSELGTDDDPPEWEVPQSPEELDTALVALQQEFEDLNDRHLRLAAEFTNYRRRNEQERLEAWSRAQAELVTRFIDVLDDLHRVAELDLSNATVEAIMEGIDLVERKFRRVLEDSGVEVLDPVGEPFDPERMEAMMRVPTDDEEQDDHVAQVFAKGYTLKGILVRPARVSVHKVG